MQQRFAQLVVRICQSLNTKRLYSLSKDPSLRNSDKFGPSVLKLNDRSGKTANRNGGRGDSASQSFKPGSLLLLIVPGAAFALGCWQVQRLWWKTALIKELEEKLEHAAIGFPLEKLDTLEEFEYRRVHLRGRFLYDNEFVIAPRGRFDKGYKQKSGGLAGDADSSSHGGHVITPFLMDKTNVVIMVNRGWLPTSKLHTPCPTSKPNETVEFDAIVRKSENRPQFVSENIPERGVWFYKNFDQMAKYCGALPVYVEAVYETTKPNGPIGGQTNINVRNEHLNYLATWFSLSAITTAMWFFKFCR